MTTRYAYVGSRTSRAREGLGRGIKVYDTTTDPTRWTFVQLVPCDNPTYLLFSPDRSVVYCAHGDGRFLSSFRVDPATGRLTLLNRTDAGGENPVHLTLSPDHRFLLVANHNSGSISSRALRYDAGIGDARSVLMMPGDPGPHRRDQQSSKPHQIVFDPTGRFAVVPDKGLDALFVVTIDHDGSLALHPDRTVRVRELSGPRHVAFHPHLPVLYSVEEFRSTVTAYDIDAHGDIQPRQIRSCTPDTVTGDSRAAEIAVSPGGDLVYASNRGGAGDHTPGGDQPDTIAAFHLDPATGLFTDAEWVETSGVRPRFFLLDGNRVLVAHERGHTIATHQIDDPTGVLGPPVVLAETGSPVMILI